MLSTKSKPKISDNRKRIN